MVLGVVFVFPLFFGGLLEVCWYWIATVLIPFSLRGDALIRVFLVFLFFLYS